MTPTTIAPTPLVYNGEVINYRDDMLSLTDMWRAAGSPSGRGPSDWRALPETIRFVDFVAGDFIAGKSGNDLFRVDRGGKAPGTWAHWQIGLAYAKYLSPAFHMWCNEVVRDKMENGERSNVSLVSRDVRCSFEDFLAIATSIKLDGNEAALCANRATIRLTGFDALAAMGATHLLAERQEELLTPTMIGKRIGGWSAKAINQRLEGLGYQEAGADSRSRKIWHPTEKGKPFGRWFDTSKSHNDGTSVQQWKWFASILEVLPRMPPQPLGNRPQPIG